MKLKVFTDGASRGNPGPAAYGFVIQDGQDHILHQGGGFIGFTTNNVAEYTAVMEALKLVKEKFESALEIELFADSLLVAKQLTGVFKLKNPRLKKLFDQIKILELEVGRVFYNHIPRSQNSLADSLANKALDRIY